MAIPGLDDEAAADPDDEVDEPATAAGAGAAILQDDDGTEKLSQSHLWYLWLHAHPCQNQHMRFRHQGGHHLH